MAKGDIPAGCRNPRRATEPDDQGLLRQVGLGSCENSSNTSAQTSNLINLPWSMALLSIKSISLLTKLLKMKNDSYRAISTAVYLIVN